MVGLDFFFFFLTILTCRALLSEEKLPKHHVRSGRGAGGS